MLEVPYAQKTRKHLGRRSTPGDANKGYPWSSSLKHTILGELYQSCTTRYASAGEWLRAIRTNEGAQLLPLDMQVALRKRLRLLLPAASQAAQAWLTPRHLWPEWARPGRLLRKDLGFLVESGWGCQRREPAAQGTALPGIGPPKLTTPRRAGCGSRRTLGAGGARSRPTPRTTAFPSRATGGASCCPQVLGKTRLHAAACGRGAAWPFFVGSLSTCLLVT